MSTRAWVWLGSLALLAHAWNARLWLSPPQATVTAPAAVAPTTRGIAAPSPPATGVVAELRVGHWTLSLRRETA